MGIESPRLEAEAWVNGQTDALCICHLEGNAILAKVRARMVISRVQALQGSNAVYNEIFPTAVS